MHFWVWEYFYWPILVTCWTALATSSPTVPTVSTTSVNDKFFKKLSENILLGVNAAFEKNRESELSTFCLLLGSLEQQAQGNEEHQQVLVWKLDEMGTKISSMIASELMVMRADIDRMNTLHKASMDILLAQLHGINDPTKVAGPSTIDTTTPLPMDGLKLTFQTPPTPMPHLPPRDEGTPQGPPKGSFSPTKLMSQGNSQPTYIRQLPRTPPWHFSTPPGWNPRGPPGPPNPGSNGGGGRGPGRGPGGGPGRDPGGSPGGDHGGGHGGGHSRGPPSRGPPGEPPGDPPGGHELEDNNEPHDEDPDHHLEDDENGSESPPPRRSEAPSGYNWDQLNSMAWKDNSSRAKTPGAGISEECNNTFCECLHEAIQDATCNILRWTPVTAGNLKTIAAGTPLPIYDGEDDLQVFMPSQCGGNGISIW